MVCIRCVKVCCKKNSEGRNCTGSERHWVGLPCPYIVWILAWFVVFPVSMLPFLLCLSNQIKATGKPFQVLAVHFWKADDEGQLVELELTLSPNDVLAVQAAYSLI